MAEDSRWPLPRSLIDSKVDMKSRDRRSSVGQPSQVGTDAKGLQDAKPPTSLHLPLHSKCQKISSQMSNQSSSTNRTIHLGNGAKGGNASQWRAAPFTSVQTTQDCSKPTGHRQMGRFKRNRQRATIEGGMAPSEERGIMTALSPQG